MKRTVQVLIASMVFALFSGWADSQPGQGGNQVPLGVPNKEGGDFLIGNCPQHKELLAKVGNKRIVVVLNEQKVYAYEGTKIVGVYDTVTGKKGHQTDTGSFNIFLKDRFYINRTGKSMPFAMFFTADRKGLHKGNIAIRDEKLENMTAVMAKSGEVIRIVEDQEIGSLGCVRLSADVAQQMFIWTPLCTPVEVSYERRE